MTEQKNQLGQRLRNLRQSRRWTLAEAAARTGLSMSTVWKVEKGLLSLTFERIKQLARGFEVEISEFFDTPSATDQFAGRRVVDRAGAVPVVDIGGNAHHFFGTEISHKHLSPFLIEVSRRQAAEPELQPGHQGQEFTFVIEGAVDLHCAGYEPLRLNAGDATYFDASMPHVYVNAATRAARMICVHSNPGSASIDAGATREFSMKKMLPADAARQLHPKLRAAAAAAHVTKRGVRARNPVKKSRASPKSLKSSDR